MSLLDSLSAESLRIIGDIDECIDAAHNEFHTERARVQDEDDGLLRELSLAIATQVEPAADAWLKMGGCCEDQSIEHNLKSFGMVFGRAMFLGGRASTQIALSAETTWEPSNYTAMGDEEFEDWKTAFAALHESRRLNEEQAVDLREKIKGLLAEMGVDAEIALVPVSQIPNEIKARAIGADEKFPGQYL